MTAAILNSKEVAGSSRSNFISSFWFLPAERRAALTSVYAFCRITDDIVDMAEDVGGEPAARQKIAEWRGETEKCFRGESNHPILAELGPVVRQYAIPQNLFFELIEGVSMDLDHKSYETFSDLKAYCYKVASVVGLMCLEVFGYEDASAKQFAVDLGIAFQLTNILRDVKTDAQRGRTYMPNEDLKRFGISREDLLALAEVFSFGGREDEFNRLFAFQIERAQSYYDSAAAHLSPRDRQNMAAPEVMRSIYHSILEKIKRDPAIVLRKKVSLSKPEAALRVFQGWLANKWAL